MFVEFCWIYRAERGDNYSDESSLIINNDTPGGSSNRQRLLALDASALPAGAEITVTYSISGGDSPPAPQIDTRTTTLWQVSVDSVTATYRFGFEVVLAGETIYSLDPSDGPELIVDFAGS